MNYGKSSSDRTDRVLVALCLLGVLLCAIVLTSESAFHFVFGTSAQDSKAQVIGKISFVHNDIRYRSAESLSWRKATAGQEIRRGESIFTGENSQSQVQMIDGGRVDLDENSLVKFTQIDNIELPDLALGNFRVVVNGKMKIAVGGEVTEIEGNKSEVQVVLKQREKPKLKLLKGTAEVRTKTTARALETNMMVSVEEAPPVPLPVPVPMPVTVSVQAKVNPLQIASPIVYVDELHDFFEESNGHLLYRKSRRSLLNLAIKVPWSTEGSADQVFGQISGSPDFVNIVDRFTAPGSETSEAFKKVILGVNYYRLSLEGEKWTEAKSFEVVAQPLNHFAPVLKMEKRIVILQDQVTLNAQIVSDLPNTVIEMSSSPQFLPEQTRIKMLSEKKFEMHFAKAMAVYIRARGVDVNSKITPASAATRVDIEKPAHTEMPHIANSDISVQQGDQFRVNWSKSPNAKKYHLQILNSAGKVIAKKTLDNEQMSLRASSLGMFKVKVAAEDAYGRVTKYSSESRIVVHAKPAPVMAKKEEPKKVEERPKVAERKPAQTISEKLSELVDYVNKAIVDSKVSLETSAFTMYSQDQIQSGKSNPTALMTGLRWMAWLGRHGFESSFLTKLFDINSAPGGGVSPMQAEARYHYRFALPWNPFSKVAQTELSLMGGYEYYRNPTSGLFSPGYQLVKAGFSVAFPLGSRWDTGGEVLYGRGFESSVKYELSGFLHYYWNKKWSLGGGYRVHMFEAGSDAVTPLGAPYREGFGEGYSVLRWHY